MAKSLTWISPYTGGQAFLDALVFKIFGVQFSVAEAADFLHFVFHGAAIAAHQIRLTVLDSDAKKCSF